MEKLLAGLDLGGTKAAAVTGRAMHDGTVQVLERRTFATGAQAAPHDVLSQCISLLTKMAPQGIAAVGVSCGGPLNTQRTHICRPPNLPLWDNVPVVSMLRESFGVPAALQNDADACALAEWRCGAGRGCRNLVFLTFGTGLGAGLILNGALYTGACGMAGEVGHIRLAAQGPVGYGKQGSFEGFCSGGGLAQLGETMALCARQNGITPMYGRDGQPVTAQSIAEAAIQGDATALRVYETCGEFLGRGIAVLADVLNPERIVLGSIFARAERLLRPAMQRILQSEALTQTRQACEIVPAQLGEALGDTAALCVALEVLQCK